MPDVESQPKINPRFAALVKSPPINCEQVAFVASFVAMRDLPVFYGTEQSGARHGYGSTLLETLQARITKPVSECWRHRQGCFFKPYPSFSRAVWGMMDGIALPVVTVIAAVGIYGNPYVMVAAACIPAIIELIAGVWSLGSALYYQAKFLHNYNAEQRVKVGEYF